MIFVETEFFGGWDGILSNLEISRLVFFFEKRENLD